MDNKQVKKLTALFYEIGTLRKILRAHQQTLLTFDPTDNIASHCFRAALIGYFMARNLKADADKVLKMCLIHDLEEIRSGDHNWVHKRYVKVFDDEVVKEQFSQLSGSEDLLILAEEYAERKTREAKIAKDADLLDQIFLLREYQWQGNQEAGVWLKEGAVKKSQQEKMLFSDLAKKLAREAKKQRPSSWWDLLWTSKRR